MNWPIELLELLALQQECERVSGVEGLAGKFGLPAREDDIASCERALGFRLEAAHRRFMSFSNGWSSFIGDINLFATQDFVGSLEFKTACDWIHELEDSTFGKYASDRNSLFPIAKGTGSTALLVMKRQHSIVFPEVIWFANEPVEEFPTFDSMFASVKAYARGSVEFWRSQRKE